MPKLKKKSVAQKAREQRERGSIARENSQYAERQKQTKRATIEMKREDPEYSQREREATAFAIHEKRKDPLYAKAELKRNTELNRINRLDPTLKTPEKKRDCEAHQIRRQDPDFRTPEKNRDATAKRQQQINLKSNFEKLKEKFHVKIRNAPTFICSCCGGLWYKESTTQVTGEILKDRGCNENLISQVLHKANIDYVEPVKSRLMQDDYHDSV